MKLLTVRSPLQADGEVHAHSKPSAKATRASSAGKLATRAGSGLGMRRRGTWACYEVAVQYLAHQVSRNVAEVIVGGASPRRVGHCLVSLPGCCGSGDGCSLAGVDQRLQRQPASGHVAMNPGMQPAFRAHELILRLFAIRRSPTTVGATRGGRVPRCQQEATAALGHHRNRNSRQFLE